MPETEKYILIVAGGEGARFKSDIPKQFVPINGKPLLFHTFDLFLKTHEAFRYVLVLSELMIPFWKDLCIQYKFTVKHQIVVGGSTRFHSVKNGLTKIPDDALVAIHDGVRPNVSRRLINEGFELAGKTGSAIPVIKVSESVRETDGTNSKPVNRQTLRLVQTPQFFQSTLIKEAYARASETNFTDDATVYEQAGHKVTLFDGERSNVKVTFKEDLGMV